MLNVYTVEVEVERAAPWYGLKPNIYAKLVAATTFEVLADSLGANGSLMQRICNHTLRVGDTVTVTSILCIHKDIDEI